MPVTNPKYVNRLRFRGETKRTLLIAAFAMLLISSFGCSSQKDSANAPASEGTGGRPELTEAVIYDQINDARVRDVADANGAAEAIFWNFDHDEPKELTVVEKQEEGNKATIVLDVKTASSPRSSNQRYLTGRIKTEWELRSGWVLRKWEIVRTENISMRYWNLPKPSGEPPQR